MRTITELPLRRAGQGVLFVLIITVHICMEQDSTEITKGAVLYTTICDPCMRFFDV